MKFHFEHPEVAADRGAAHKGPNHWNWKGGITDEMKALRESDEYNAWRRSVYERDAFTCKDCGSNNDIVAHHLKPFRDYPGLRFDADNGITLCRPYHKKRHSEVGLSTRFKPTSDALPDYTLEILERASMYLRSRQPAAIDQPWSIART